MNYRADNLFCEFWGHVNRSGRWVTRGVFGLPMSALFVVDDFGWLVQVGPVLRVG